MSFEKVVLLSGGVDSATCLAIAVSECGADKVLALTADYGQRHKVKETAAAIRVAEYYGVRQEMQLFPDVFAGCDCSLLESESSREICHESYADQISKNGKVDTYVPFRNGVMIAHAVAFAMRFGAREVWYGAHRDDAAGNAYPDCTPWFHRLMTGAVEAGTGGACTLKAPFLHWSKADIIRRGLAIGVPYELTWSCYEGGDRPCGKCATCIDRGKAFDLNGVPDPAMKEE